MRNLHRRGFTLIELILAIVLLAGFFGGLALLGWLVYVATHFIGKYW